MKPDLKTLLPGYKVNKYLLILNPHEELWNRIMKVKEHFAKSFKAEDNIWTRPQLTLVSFVQYEMMEERILNRLRVTAMGHYPFKVELKDFGSFPSHTIHLNVTSKVPIQDLIKSVRTDTQRLMKFDADNQPHFMMEPHITIASKLKPWQYEKSWLEYSNTSFSGRFIADQMLLLKRPVDEKKYQVAGRFEFQNLPVSTKQGDLFG